MFKEIIKGMEYADWYGIVSLLIFFVFFLFLLFRTMRLDKSFVQELSHMPLDDFNNDHNDNPKNQE